MIELPTPHAVPVELRRDEPLGDALRRICLHQLDRAIRALENDEIDQGIHTARKATKRTRALLRLCRDTIGQRIYRAENIALRDAARLLAPARDSMSVGRTLAGLRDRYDGQLKQNSFLALDRQLAERHLEEVARARTESLPVVRNELESARRRYQAWPDTEGGSAIADDFASIESGMRRVYRRGRRRMTEAYADPSDANFHEWRKRIKYLRYQLETLRPIWPEVMTGLARSLDNLGELAGRHHDLKILAETAAGQPGFEGPESDLLSALVAREQVLLQSSARALGRRIYPERPRLFSGRMEVYWEAWKE